jgi:polysaccharide pyruvyl transferase CsaB
MKVLHLIGGGDVGGAKVHVLSLVKELSKHIDVKIVSFRPGAFADDAHAMGIDIEVVRTGNIFRDIKRVINMVREGEYQIIHSHGAKANLISIITKIFTKIPTVTTVHSDYKLDYMHSALKTLTFGSINSVALRYIDYYIGVSRNFKQMLIERNFNSDNIFILYNGMDFNKPLKQYSREEFSKRYKLELVDDDIVVGIAARLYPVKGIDTLIEAAKLVIQKNPHVKFIIGGDGEDRDSLEQKASSLGVRNNVFFLGWLDDPYELMSNVDISVLTSISESFPYSILEGARFKKATISSRVGGIPDLIDHGENGYLFNPGDYHKLAEYILELADDSTKRMEMGEKIYNKASTLFSLENMCNTQLNIYNKILKRASDKNFIGFNYDVIISGYYGFNNMGDDAMLMAIIDNLRQYREDIRIVTLSHNPMETKRSYGVDSISRVNLFYIYQVMRKARLFIYGGGNLIQDNTSTRSLLYYLGTIWIAKKMNLKVMFYANGIGPLNKNANKDITRKILNRVDVITLREELSLQELKNLNIDGPETYITADPAFTVRPASDNEVDELFEKEGIDMQGPYVGFSVRKWHGHEKYKEAIIRAADHMIDKYGIKPVFIPMHCPDDLYIIEDIVAKMKGKAWIIRNTYSIPQIIGVIKRMEMLIGMRLHALIFAASLSVPFLGLAYEPKVEGFLRYTNQASAGDVRYLECEKLIQLADDVWERRAEIREQLEKGIGKFQEKALENAQIAIDLIDSAV